MIANFAPSGAAVSRYYCEVDSAELLLEAVNEINNLTTNTTRENSAVIKLIDNIELVDDVLFGSVLFDSMSEEEVAEFLANPRPFAFVTLDLNGHVLWLRGCNIVSSYLVDLEIIDSNPTVENVLPDKTMVTGGAMYGNGTLLASYNGFMTISGGNFCGDDMALGAITGGSLTINKGVISCSQTDINTKIKTGILVFYYHEYHESYDDLIMNHVTINGGQIDYPVIVYDSDSGEVSTDPEIIAECVTVDESKVNVKKDSFGNIIGYAEKVIEPEPTPTPEDPEDPENPDEQDPTEEQKPSDNKTPVISGTTDNGQPTSDDFMQIMMIGILVIVALSVVSIAASLLIIKKYRPRVA